MSELESELQLRTDEAAELENANTEMLEFNSRMEEEIIELKEELDTRAGEVRALEARCSSEVSDRTRCVSSPIQFNHVFLLPSSSTIL